MTSPSAPGSFRERLVPGPSLFLALLLLIPAVALVVTPLSTMIAFPVAIVCYFLVALLAFFLSPTVEVVDGELIAGQARIPVALLGEIELLGPDGLRGAIGPGLDARAYLMVRGYIHRGIRVAVNDPADPAPYWIITSRKPRTLRAAIEAAQPATA